MNLLLITTDQQRWDMLGFRAAFAGLRTPNLDRLAAEGTVLDNTFATCPICMPTRFTWLHGLYASQAHARLTRNAHDWPDHLATFTGALQRRGYRTALIGKLHSHAGLYPLDLTTREHETRARGFDDVVETSGKILAFWFDCRWTEHLRRRGLLERYREHVKRRPDAFGEHGPYDPTFLDAADTMDGFIGRSMRDWIARYDDERPWFCHLSFCGPHFPIDPPPEYATRHLADDMPPPEGDVPREKIADALQRRAMSCAMVEQIDDEIGRVLESLGARGMLEDTLIVFTTDHGDMQGCGGQVNKGQAHDGSTRTPIIVWKPGVVPAGVTCHAMVESVDLPVTLLEAASGGTASGGDAAEHLPNTPGRSCWPVILGRTDDHRECCYAERGDGGKPGDWRMIRDARWKYVYQLDGRERLYDMANDPWECRDVATEPVNRDVVDAMRLRLIGAQARALPPDTRPLRVRFPDDFGPRTVETPDATPGEPAASTTPKESVHAHS